METQSAQSSRTVEDRPSLAFSDAESALRWAKTLPFLNLSQVYEQVIGQLHALSAAEFTPRERATIAELMREQAMHLHTELARRYAGKPQPLVDRELEAADEAVALWGALWEQYSACLKPLLEGDPELTGVRAKILQRGLHVGKQMLLVHGLSRRVPTGTFWQELHAYYRLAEMLDCTVAAVSDDLNPQAVGMSCYSTYVHALLLGLADPFSMSVRQIELCDCWLSQWARKVFPYERERESEGPVIMVDLDQARGPVLVATTPAAPPPSMRFGYPGKLAMSVRGRLKRLSTGANPAELQLGHDVSVEQCVVLLTHLDQRWNQLPAAQGEVGTGRLEICGGGLPSAYFRVGGRTFDRQDPLGRLTFQGTQHLQTLGALTDYDRYKEEAQRNWPWERWVGRYEWNQATMTRQGAAGHRWFLDALAAIDDGERIRLGHVTRVALGANDQLSLTLRLWSGAPRTMAVRPLSHAFSEDPPIPVVLLSETPGEKASAIVPPRTFNPGRLLRSVNAGPERKLKLTRLLYRGADFERVAFDED